MYGPTTHWLLWLNTGEEIVENVSSRTGAGGGGTAGFGGTGDEKLTCDWVADRPYGSAGIVTCTCRPRISFSYSVFSTATVGSARKQSKISGSGVPPGFPAAGSRVHVIVQ